MIRAGRIRRWFDRFRRAAPTAGLEVAAGAAELAHLPTALASANSTFEAWWNGARALDRLLLYSDGASDPSRVEALLRREPERCRRTIARAQRISRHEFQMLGSSAFVPRDPDRPRGTAPFAPDYEPIDWTLDPVSGLRFPRGVPYREWKLYEMRPGLADIKLPWELARCQHWPVLAQAYLLSGESAFAAEIGQQLIDFGSSNPVGFGIHWTCTMDVALRAANWAIALRLLRGAPEEHFPLSLWEYAFAELFTHGAFIRANLENHYEVTSNHYLSNVVGLYFVAQAFADLDVGREWASFARDSLEQEIDVQVLADGADFESSIPYHRLVAELFLGGARLADIAGTPLSDHYRTRLGAMTDYLASVLRPDGAMPQVGDADDGRLHVFSDYGDWRPQDPRHLFGPAGRTLRTERWQPYEGESAHWETTWWGFDPPTIEAADQVADQPPQLPAIGRHFEQAGVAVFRDGGQYLAITNGVVGTRGFGNHKHNELLSFELHLQGRPLIVDPGSFVYTGDPDARNRFRGTGFHNTLRIDGVEQNELPTQWLFRLMEAAHPETLGFRIADEFVEHLGRHRGYERLSSPVRHERAFRFLRGPGALLILDRLIGEGEHTLTWHFHTAPGVEFCRESSLRLGLDPTGMGLVLDHPPELSGDPVASEYSPSYGVRVPCMAVDLSTRVALTKRTSWRFVIADPNWLAREATSVDQHYLEMTAALRDARG